MDPNIEEGQSPVVMDEDKTSEVTDVIGGSGKWQMFIFGIVFASKFLGAYHNFAGTFTAPKIAHWCAQPREGPWSTLQEDEWKNVTQKCHRPTDQSFVDHWSIANNSEKEHCSRWDYDHSVFSSTITERWDLVCEKSWMSSMLKTVYMAGFLAACLIMGTLADKWGRRVIILVCGIIFISAAIVNAFSPNYSIFALTRFLVAFGRTGLMNASYILMMEVFGNSERPLAGTMTKMGFVLGYMSLPGIAYCLSDWFQLQLTITAPVILLAIMVFFVPESPRWLITNDQLDKAAQVLAKAAAWNGRTLSNPEATVKALAAKTNPSDKTEKEVGGFRLVRMMKMPNMRKKSLIMFFQWFVVSFVFYGLSFNAGDLGGNLFLNFAIFGACQIPANFLAIYTLNRLGRRNTVSGGMVIAGLASLAVLTVAQNPDLLWVRLTLATVAMSFISACFNGAYIYSSEIFPTEVRSVGLTSASVFARFGSMTSPFMKELGTDNHFMVPMGIFGVLSIATGLLIRLLPETKGQPLPETLEQGESFGVTINTVQNGHLEKPVDQQSIHTLTEFPKPNNAAA